MFEGFVCIAVVFTNLLVSIKTLDIVDNILRKM